jgi:hypothetical protein
MTTHYMDEAEVCDRIGVIDHGSLVGLDTPAALKRSVGGDVITLSTDDPAAAAAEIRERYSLEPEIRDSEVSFTVEGGDRFLPEFVRGFGRPIDSIGLRHPTLDDVFLHLTGVRSAVGSTRRSRCGDRSGAVRPEAASMTGLAGRGSSLPRLLRFVGVLAVQPFFQPLVFLVIFRAGFATSSAHCAWRRLRRVHVPGDRREGVLTSSRSPAVVVWDRGRVRARCRGAPARTESSAAGDRCRGRRPARSSCFS